LCVIGWCGWPHAGCSLKTAVLTRRPDIPLYRNLFFLLCAASNLDFSVKKERKIGRLRFLTGAKETGVTPRIWDSVRDTLTVAALSTCTSTSSQHDPLSLFLSLLVLCMCVSERRLAARRSPDVGYWPAAAYIYLLSISMYILAKKCT
jgi:hypothetical protein